MHVAKPSGDAGGIFLDPTTCSKVEYAGLAGEIMEKLLGRMQEESHNPPASPRSHAAQRGFYSFFLELFFSLLPKLSFVQSRNSLLWGSIARARVPAASIRMLGPEVV